MKTMIAVGRFKGKPQQVAPPKEVKEVEIPDFIIRWQNKRKEVKNLGKEHL